MFRKTNERCHHDLVKMIFAKCSYVDGQSRRSMNVLKVETRRYNVQSGHLIILIPCSRRLFHRLLALWLWRLLCVCVHIQYGFKPHSAFSSSSFYHNLIASHSSFSKSSSKVKSAEIFFHDFFETSWTWSRSNAQSIHPFTPRCKIAETTPSERHFDGKTIRRNSRINFTQKWVISPSSSGHSFRETLKCQRH